MKESWLNNLLCYLILSYMREKKNAWKNNKYEQDNRTLTLTAERPKVAIQWSQRDQRAEQNSQVCLWISRCVHLFSHKQEYLRSAEMQFVVAGLPVFHHHTDGPQQSARPLLFSRPYRKCPIKQADCTLKTISLLKKIVCLVNK